MVRNARASYKIVHNTKLEEAENKIDMIRNNYLKELLQLRRKYSKLFVKVADEYNLTYKIDQQGD